MRNILFLFTIALLLGSKSVCAQKKINDAHISGHVIDAITKEHIPYATIIIKDANAAVATDHTGHYILNNLTPGTHKVEASFLGYKAEIKEITTGNGEPNTLNFELEPQMTELNEVVVTSNRNPVKRRESASVVNLASNKLFLQTASATPAEALNFGSGMRVEWNCGNCGVPQLRINGLSGQYSQILLDSRPIFSSLAAVYGLEQIPESMIDRVEVIRGGGSTLFGSNAIGGVVNIITKEAHQNGFSLSNTSSFMGNSPDIVTSLNGSVISKDLRSGLYLFGMIRNRENYDRNNDSFSEIPELKSNTVGFRGYHKTSEKTKLTLEYHHIGEFRRGGNLFDRPAHEADIAEQLDHDIHGVAAKFDGYTHNQRYQIYSSFQNIDRKSYFGTQQNPDAYGKTNDKTAVGGGQWNYLFDNLWFMPATFTVGAEYTYNHLNDKMLGYNRILNQITHTTGVYAQNEWRNDNFTILAGVRADKHNKIKQIIFSPRVSFRYMPVSWLTLRTGYAAGYRAPQAYDEDLHVAAVGGEVSLIELAPDLKPEYSHSFTLSTDFYHRFGVWQANLLIEGFYTDLRDVFALNELGKNQQGNLILQRVNATGARVAGANIELRLATNKFDMQLGYTQQISRYKEAFEWSQNVAAQKKMFRSPDSYGYMTTSYNPWKTFKASLSANYTGKMLVQHYAGYIPEDCEKETKSFVDLGMKLSYTFKLSSQLKLEINGGVKNILDSFQNDLDSGVYKDAKYIWGAAIPRTLFVGAKISL